MPVDTLISCSKHEHCFTQYWKLDRRHRTCDKDELRQYLRSNGYYFFAPIANVARLRYLCTRAARNLISYDRFNIHDLENFCTQRMILIPANTPRRRYALRAILEAADEASGRFTKFMHLPTETRLIIYHHHIDWLRTRLDSCETQPYRAVDWSFVAPPPLATASRQLRDEFMPDFYRIMNFSMIALSATLPITAAEQSQSPLLRHPHLRDIQHFRVLARYRIEDAISISPLPFNTFKSTPHTITNGEPRWEAGTMDRLWARLLATGINQLYALLLRQGSIEDVQDWPLTVLTDVFAELERLKPGWREVRFVKEAFVGVWEGYTFDVGSGWS